MDSVIFGPKEQWPPNDDALRALPLNWMNVACADARFRRRTGWMGLAACPSDPRSWTCRIAARPGVFGVAPVRVERLSDVSTADFTLFYFPVDDEEIGDRVSVAAAIAMTRADRGVLRDFSAHDDLAAPFAVAQMQLAVTAEHRSVALALSALERRRIILPEGLRAPFWEGWVVPPGGDDEDLPAFDIARDLFAVFAAGLAAAVDEIPAVVLGGATPATGWRRLADGRMEAEPKTPTRELHDLLVWGDKSESLELLPALASPRDDFDPACYLAASEVAQDAPTERSHLIVLTGFLGSGKTSFLNQFIEYHTGRNELVTVIQNELGDRGVDALLLEGDESVLEVEAGCICCTVAGALMPAVQQLVSRFSPDLIVLETTGVANPLNMVEELRDLDHLVTVEAVITVVDAARFDATLEASDVARGQIAAADTIVLNKCDLVDEERLAGIAAKLRQQNPQVRILRATHGRVNPNELSRSGARLSLPEDEDGARCCCGGHGQQHHDQACCCGHDRDDDDHACCGSHAEHAAHHDEEHCCCGGHDEDQPCCGSHAGKSDHVHTGDQQHCYGHHEHCDHHSHGHSHADHGADGFSVRNIAMPARVDLAALQATLLRCPAQIHRIKGVIHPVEDDEVCVLQFVPGQIEFVRPERPASAAPFLIAIGQNLDDPALAVFWNELSQGGMRAAV